ncbi:MAG: BrnT family toxin [Lachnospiraceae bacterium]|nr:BrnT family toxin [Lachnospiraceae bacterium]
MPDVYYSNTELTFVWDSDKNELNYKKHGITFQTAARVFEDELRLEFTDPRHSDEEERYITIGLVHKILTVVYCDRKNNNTGNTDIRIISARIATNTEMMMYNNNQLGRY